MDSLAQDVREDILTRLLDLLLENADTWQVRSVLRNVVSLNEDDVLPALVVLDGDETPIDDEPHRRPTAVPRLVEMTPIIFVALGSEPESVGAELNTLRRQIIKAVLSDSALLALVDRQQRIRYDGLETPRSEMGRLEIGQRYLRFTFTYLLIPSRL